MMMHDGSTYGAFPIHATFADLDSILGSQKHQTVETVIVVFVLSFVVVSTVAQWIVI